MSGELSEMERGILTVFRELGVESGSAVPEAVLAYRCSRAGFIMAYGEFETALLNLEFRGLTEPGSEPINARSWQLTDDGAELLYGPITQEPTGNSTVDDS